MTRRTYSPALRGVFGDWAYYSCLMTVREVTSRVHFADEIHTAKKLSDWIQRKIQSGRSREIAAYLKREQQRFFNSLVVAIYDGDPGWHGLASLKAQAAGLDISAISEDAQASLGFLSFTGREKMFAIDGQHRLAGLKEGIAENPMLGNEEISVILVRHTASKRGLERTRRLFTTLNKTARAVGKGEIIALDEDDVMAIITRSLVESDPRLNEKRIKFVQSESLPKDATEFTTIGNLYDILTVLFTKVGIADAPKGRLKTLRFMRPPDDQIREYKDLATAFFDRLGDNFRPLSSYFSASDTDAPAVVARYRHRRGGQVLFRPVGLRLYAELVTEIVQRGIELDEAIAQAATLPQELSEQPYRGLLWLPETGNINHKPRPLCRRLLLYMLGYETDVEQLRERYAAHFGLASNQIELPTRIR